ncbi:MAG: glycerophosphodiester phosphodiesterase [Planctomycetaceae bacterium]|nr:glycerophosphodiester phosphodiesterase [Planctomycetaceae bacterium]
MSKGTVRNYTLFAYSISFLIITCSGVSVVGQINDDAPSARRDVDRSQAVPIVIGHRGACGYLPEHTTESAVLAHAMQADYIEQDVVLSKDGIPIVLHDLTLDDVTDVARVFPDRRRADEHWYAFDFTLAELRRLRIFERRSSGRPWRDKGTRFPLDTGSFRISTLAEHLQLIQGLNKSRAHQAGVYVEFKGAAEHRAEGLDLSRAILDVLTEYGYESAEDRIYLQCFDEAEVRRLRKELKTPLLIIQLLATPVDTAKLKSIAEVADGIGVPLEHVVTGQHADGTPQMTELVSNAHANALQVHVWTFRTDALPSYVGSAADYLEWLTVAAGVDGIFADQPDVVVQWRAARRQQVNGGNQFRLLNERAVPESD